MSALSINSFSTATFSSPLERHRVEPVVEPLPAKERPAEPNIESSQSAMGSEQLKQAAFYTNQVKQTNRLIEAYSQNYDDSNTEVGLEVDLYQPSRVLDEVISIQEEHEGGRGQLVNVYV